MSKVMRAIGLMSGTSMDGIDIALIETDGDRSVRRLAASSEAYPDDFRAQLRQAMADAQAITSREQRPGCLADVERELTERHAAAVTRFMGDRMLQPSAVDVIGFHGQTVLHREELVPAGTFLDRRLGVLEERELPPRTRLLTVQLGDGPLLARRTGVDVVHDLRANDCALGGQGAPLVPIYHWALAAKVPERPIAFVNIGGVSNITWMGPGGRLIAFDTGPGNALIDDWMLRHTGTARDEGGRLAAAGNVDEGILRRYLSQPYFAKVAPKSLDRNAFPPDLVAGLSVADGAATLTAFTAEAIARARELVPEQPLLWIIAGGGRRNQTLMRMIAARVENAVVPAEALDLDGDTMEAEAWAYLAVRSLKGLPLTFPETTGVAEPAIGGKLARAPF
ncbi:MAG: anhydro-N-acetylmuramic acid kinase [Hyphomicrobiaceae bacterium]